MPKAFTSFFVLIISLAIAVSVLDIDCFAEQELSLSAESAVLIEAGDGQILAAKNANRRMGMASTTKILTALVVLEHLDISETVKIPQEAVGIEGSSVYLVLGEELTVGELLYALLLASANDAAVALAIAAGGDVETFVGYMNDYTEQMGLESTHVTNPHGLYDKEHYTTAYELAKITMRAVKNPTLREIASTYRKSIPYCGKPNGRTLVNHNKLLKLYSGADGMKTGFTKDTGRCLVSSATRDGLTLIAVTLRAPDDWNDHIKLLNYGFQNYMCVTAADIGEYVCSFPVVGGKEEFVTLTNSEAITFCLPRRHGDFEYKIEATSHFEYAPVLKGAFVATLTVKYGNKSKSCDLVSVHEVEQSFKRAHK